MARILVVDDEAAFRGVLRRILERAGYAVQEADSASAAMTIVMSDDRPDVVVSDVMMPGKNGLIFYADLVESAPALRNRVIFLTGAAHDRGVHDRIEQLGVPLIAKLEDMQVVVDAVRIAVLNA